MCAYKIHFLLQTICRAVFEKLYPFHMNLLYNPPTTIKERLGKLLEECLKPGLPQIEWNLLNDIKLLLLSSIDSEMNN